MSHSLLLETFCDEGLQLAGPLRVAAEDMTAGCAPAALVRGFEWAARYERRPGPSLVVVRIGR
jgi:hypothetical protein